MQTLSKFNCLLAALFLALTSSMHAADLIPLGSNWKYVIGTNEPSSPSSAWRQTAYNDGAWAAGLGPIGYDTGGSPGTAPIATLLPDPRTAGNPVWTNTYFRKTFTVASPAAITELLLTVYVDDGAVAWVNGVEVGRINVPDGELTHTSAAVLADETRTLTTTNIASLLVAGNNVVAVQALNGPAASSDFVFEAQLTSAVDEAPTVIVTDPAPSSIVQQLTLVGIVFSENVSGVNAGDLLINGVAATSVATNNPRDYTFQFPQPPTGAVSVAWAVNPDINDIDGSPNPFVPGGAWIYTLNPNAIASAVIISEFMADNENGISDEDGTRSDWIELYNPGLVDVGLDGWFLSDTSTNLAKWRLPNFILGANKYLRIWASEKNRRNPGSPFHTNFKLSKNVGGFLGLSGPATNLVSSFSGTNNYPAQLVNVSFGRDRVDPDIVGYFLVPTPGAQNSTSGTGFALAPTLSQESGVYTNASLSLVITVPAGTTVRYTTDGTNPTNTSTAYTTPLNLVNNTTLKVRAFPTAPRLFPSEVLVRNFIFLDASTKDFNSNLPILIMSTEGRAMVSSAAAGFPRTKGTFVVFDTYRGRSAFSRKPEHIGPADFETFGQTSEGFPKKPYNIETQDAIGNDAKESILGMPAEADWKLRNPYSDKCLMNDYLAYELFEQMGNYSCRRKFVEVFVDTGGGRLSYPGDYIGVEVFLEKIERGKDRVDIAELTPSHTNQPSITGGFMFKKDKDSSGDLNFTAAGQGLKLHEPKPKEMRSTLTAGITSWPGAGYTPSASNQMTYLVNYLNAFNTAMTAADWKTRTGTNHYSHYIDVDSFVDSHWIVEFPKQIDGYRISNFFRKDRNGKVKNAPIWDWNLSFGNADYLDGGNTSKWYYAVLNDANAHIWLSRLVGNLPIPNTTQGDPDFIQKIVDRWGVLRTNVMNGTRLTNRIDEIGTILAESAARNFSKYVYLNTYQWPNPQGPPANDVDYTQPTYALIISEMKKWTYGRYVWIDNQFPKSPLLNLPEGDVVAGATLIMTPPAGTIYYTLDGTDPRASQAEGAVAAGALTYTSQITLNANARVFARARVGTAWSPPTIATYVVQRPRLVITEIMYHPLPPGLGSTNIDEDFEYLEFRNVGATPLNVNGYTLDGGVSFTFPNRVLAAGERILVVNNLAAFNSRYPGLSGAVVGEFAGVLANDGNRLVLQGRLREPILDFSYDDQWQPITDGFGFSLVIIEDTAAVGTWAYATSWRASGTLGGSPGAGDAATSIPQVVVNEALTHSDPAPPSDTIELRNLSNTAADIGHWYLTDDFREPKKYRIAAGTTIPAGGYLTFNEGQFNTPTNAPTSFALSSSGDEVYLFSGNSEGEITGYVHGFDFGPALNGVTFGRHVLSTGEDVFVTQSSATLGGANAGPKVGPIVISEIMYHPPDVFANGGSWDNTEDEFIELQNISNASVDLYDPLNRTNTWRLRDAVDFTFPAGVTVPSGGFVLVVSFSPTNSAALAAFRSANGVPVSTPIYGPWQGKLDNSQDSVELVQPGVPDAVGTPTAGQFLYVLADKVKYEHIAPWPVGLPDGLGASLGRIDTAAYGNDPGNWRTSPKTPGAPMPSGGTAPTIVVQPVNTAGIEGQSASFSLTATGSSLGYIWTFNDKPLSGASAPVLTLNNLNMSQVGNYACYVFNTAGSVQSSSARLTVRTIPRITQQPVGRAVYIKPDPKAANLPNGTNVTFTTVATSSEPPISYQWRFNGSNIPGAVGSTYTVLDVQLEDEGDYTCAVTDGTGTIYSQPARLTPWLQPIIVQKPTDVIVAAGSDFSVGVGVTGNPMPFAYSWRRSLGSVVVNTNSGSYKTNFITLNTVAAQLGLLNNIQSSNFVMRLVVYNDANTAPGATATFNVTVLEDTDRDGIPNSIEQGLGLSTNNAADAVGDLDLDGMNNRAEYLAGTDPTNSLSYLKVEQSVVPGTAAVQFASISNRTYTIQFTDSLGAGSWSKLEDILARPTNFVHQVADRAWTTNRFYRVVLPAQP